MKKIRTKLVNLGVSLMMALLAFSSLPAFPAAAAVTVGPIDPASVWPGAPAGVATGFPAWYQDATGTRVKLLPITAVSLADPVDPLNPYSRFIGFGSEAFYYMASADVASPTVARGLAEFAYEASFVNGFAEAGQETVFARTRIRIQVPAPGTYTVQHPYGQDVFTVTAADIATGRGINFTEDIGLAPRNFLTSTTSRISAFLKPVAPPALPGVLGDGISAGPVTGGPLRNSVILTGPAGVDLTGTGSNVLTITSFTVAAALFAAVTPLAAFTATPVTGSAPLTVSFTDTSAGPATSWNWSFGDGTANITGNPTPTHIFSKSGNFTVSLTVNNVVGPASTTTRVIQATAAAPAIPVASFVMSGTGGAAPLPVDFTDTSTGAPTTFQWNFGDGSPPSNLQNPSHTYLAAGTFTVTELVSNALGSAATSKIITVTPPVPAPPVASFTMTPAVGVPPLAVRFTDTTTGVPTAWSWDFGDGSPLSTVQNPTHTFRTVGFFAVTETVSNALGTGTVSQVVTTANVPAAPTGLTANVSSATQVNLTWVDNSNNEQIFMIQRATNATFTAGAIEVHTPANSTAFSDITATANTTFFYRVIAGGLVGNSAASNVVTVTTPAAGAPVPPPPPPPAPPPVSAPAPAAPPPVFASIGGGGGGGAAAPAPSFTPINLSGLVTGTGLRTDSSGRVEFDAQVKTSNDDFVLVLPAGTSITDRDGARIDSLTAAASTSPPAPPSGERVLFSYNMGPDGTRFEPPIGIMLRFDPAKLPAGVTPDRLYIAFHDGTNWVKIDSSLDAAANTLTATAGHFTQFALIAVAPAAPAPPPPPAPPEREEIIAPAIPGNLTARVNANGEVTLAWTDASTNENAFMIERAQDEAFETGEAEFHIVANSQTFTDITATPGKTYFYRVEAVTGVGHSPPSNVVSVTIPEAAPPPVAPATPTPAPPTSPATTPAPPTPSAPAQAPSMNWGLIIGIGAAIVVIAVLAIAMTRKKTAG